MVKVMIGHVWPAGEPQIKRRVALAASLLVGAKVLDIFMSSSYLLCCITSSMTPIKSVIISFNVKVINTSVPFFLSHAIDKLNSTGVLHLDPTTSQAAVTTTVTAALVSSH